MNNKLIDSVMNAIRLDGKEAAPIYLLTMEDGGDCWNPGDAHSLEVLASYYAEANAHCSFDLDPEKETTTPLGRPGVIASKIMTGLRDGSIGQWRDYRGWTLYRESNEANLKFYPIGKPNQSYWDEGLGLHLGMNLQEYRDRCKNIRPEIILASYGEQLLSPNHFTIILAAKDEWLSVLRLAAKRKSLMINFENPRNGYTRSNRLAYQLFSYDDGSPAFAYFSMFLHGISGVDIQAFCDLIRKVFPRALGSIKGYITG